MRDTANEQEMTETDRSGKAGWIILWLLGVPIPVLLIMYMISGCT